MAIEDFREMRARENQRETHQRETSTQIKGNAPHHNAHTSPYLSAPNLSPLHVHTISLSPPPPNSTPPTSFPIYPPLHPSLSLSLSLFLSLSHTHTHTHTLFGERM